MRFDEDSARARHLAEAQRRKKVNRIAGMILGFFGAVAMLVLVVIILGIMSWFVAKGLNVVGLQAEIVDGGYVLLAVGALGSAWHGRGIFKHREWPRKGGDRE